MGENFSYEFLEFCNDNFDNVKENDKNDFHDDISNLKFSNVENSDKARNKKVKFNTKYKNNIEYSKKNTIKINSKATATFFLTAFTGILNATGMDTKVEREKINENEKNQNFNSDNLDINFNFKKNKIQKNEIEDSFSKKKPKVRFSFSTMYEVPISKRKSKHSPNTGMTIDKIDKQPLSNSSKKISNTSNSQIKANTESERWTYYGGDEFNDNSFDTSKWSAYDNNNTYGHPQDMIQYYNASQISETTDAQGNGVLNINSNRMRGTTITTSDGQSREAWNSGFITSGGRYAANPANVFYPLYSRIDVRAKVANEIGFWHAPWVTHYNGASTAELDIGEFFAPTNGKNVVTQSIHLYNKKMGTVQKNVVNGGIKNFRVKSDVQNDFHVYSVSVEPSSTPNEAIITYWVDDNKVYSFATDSKGAGLYNKFIEDSIKDNRLDSTWNIMFQGGVGGNGYPITGLDSAQSVIDYIRVFVPAAQVQSVPAVTPVNPATTPGSSNTPGNNNTITTSPTAAIPVYHKILIEAPRSKVDFDLVKKINAEIYKNIENTEDDKLDVNITHIGNISTSYSDKLNNINYTSNSQGILLSALKDFGKFTFGGALGYQNSNVNYNGVFSGIEEDIDSFQALLEGKYEFTEKLDLAGILTYSYNNHKYKADFFNIMNNVKYKSRILDASMRLGYKFIYDDGYIKPYLGLGITGIKEGDMSKINVSNTSQTGINEFLGIYGEKTFGKFTLFGQSEYRFRNKKASYHTKRSYTNRYDISPLNYSRQSFSFDIGGDYKVNDNMNVSLSYGFNGSKNNSLKLGLKASF